MFHEPKLICVLHVPEVEVDKLLLFLLNVVTYIADVSEYLGDDGMHFDFYFPLAEDLITGL